MGCQRRARRLAPCPERVSPPERCGAVAAPDTASASERSSRGAEPNRRWTWQANERTVRDVHVVHRRSLVISGVAPDGIGHISPKKERWSHSTPSGPNVDCSGDAPAAGAPGAQAVINAIGIFTVYQVRIGWTLSGCGWLRAGRPGPQRGEEVDQALASVDSSRYAPRRHPAPFA